MGLSFRKSFKMGPLRVNLSGAGVGVSAGIRGARVSVGPRGTYVTLSGGGFRYQKKLHASPPAPRSQAVLPAVSSQKQLTVPEGHIHTASVEDLLESSPEDLLSEIQKRTDRVNWFSIYLVGAGLLLLYVASLDMPWLMALALAGSAAGSLVVYLWNRERRTARLIYDVDNAELLERFAVCNSAGEALSRSVRLWHIYSNIRAQDKKRNAGASSLIRRTRVFCVPRAFPLIECNIEPWSIPAGPQQLLFLPDRLLIHQGSSFAGVPYSQLDAEASTTPFIEEESVPADAQVVSRTWRFVNKSGGPDLRFNNNRQLPVVAYGKVELRSASGLHVVFQCSSAEAADATKSALDLLRRMSHVNRAEHPEKIELVVADQAGAVAPLAPAPMQESGALEALAVATVLRYIAVADRRFSSEEKQQLDAAVREFCGDDSQAALSTLDKVPELRSDAASVAEALLVLQAARPNVRKRVVQLAVEMAGADGNTTPKEKERIQEIWTALVPDGGVQ